MLENYGTSGRGKLASVDIRLGPYTDVEIAAIIPAYNEELAIGSLVLKTKEHVTDVFVIDDGSTDRTADIAAKAGARVIRLSENSGKAFALMTGFKAVTGNGYKAVVMLDGDGQHDPEEIERLVEPVLTGEADLVIGSRFLDAHNHMPRYRQVGQKVLNGFTSMGAEVKITDSQSGFRALSRRSLASMDFDSAGYNIESDMIMAFAQKGLKIEEVPISVSYDVPNQHKKNSVSHGVGVLNEVIGFVGMRRPLLFFAVPGAILFGTGLFLGMMSFFQEYLFGMSWLFQSMLGAFMVTIGLILVVSGLMLNSLVVLMHMNKVHQ
jgi:glycosyltransferase involved in cell wall biosynthesis